MITYTQQNAHLGAKDVVITSWSDMPNGEVGQPLPLAMFADRSVQVSGTFGAGGVVTVEGSNNGTDYVTLTDPQGNPLSFTQAKIEAITEMVAYIRPNVTAGDGTTALTVTLAAKA